MEKTRNYIKWLGALAITGAALAVMADLFSGWSENPNAMPTALSLSLDNVKGLFIGKSRWSFILGNYLAIFFLPFHIIGSYLIFLAMKPGGKKFALIYLFPAIYLIVLGTGYHGTYAFVADVVQFDNLDLMNKINGYWQPWGVLIAVGYSLLSFYLFVRIAQKRTIFPRWIALFSPISIIMVTAALTIALPDNLVGLKVFLTVTGLNLPLAIFYVITTRYLLKEKNLDMRIP